MNRTHGYRTIIASSVFIILIVANIALPYLWSIIPDPELIRHLLITLSAVVGVHLLDRVWLWKDMAEWNTNSLRKIIESSNQLISGASKCGIKNIYYSRQDAQKQIMETINTAEDRAWFLGIAFSENIHLNEILSAIDSKVNKEKFDFKMLLLDALRSTATFRAFLESTPDLVEKIVSTNRDNEDINDPIFDTRLFMDFSNSIGTLNTNINITHAIRFYAHMPMCWLVIIDNTMYFQPYSFGRGKIGTRINPYVETLMPVFEIKKIENQSTSESEKPVFFDILEDHFYKLWITSDTDLFHIAARRVSHKCIVKDLFQTRSSWLNHVYRTLYVKPAGKDRRRFPRQVYKSDHLIMISWKKDENEYSAISRILDYSREGLCLEILKKDDIKSLKFLENKNQPLEVSKKNIPSLKNLINDIQSLEVLEKNIQFLKKEQEVGLTAIYVPVDILSRFIIDCLLNGDNKFFVKIIASKANSKSTIGIYVCENKKTICNYKLS